MTDGRGNADMVRTVAEQMADALVDAAWRKLKDEQAETKQRTASLPAWGGLALSLMTSLLVIAVWFGSARSDIAHASDIANQAKAKAEATDSKVSEVKETVGRIDENVKLLRGELGR